MSVQLYCGDCLEILPMLEPESVDAVITDPPYGIGYNRNTKHKGQVKRPTVIGDDEPFDPAPLLRFAKLILWGANCYASRLPDSKTWLCWKKTLTNGDKGQAADFELAWARGIGRSRFFQHLWAGCYRASEAGQFYHPTQKPIALMHWCLDLLKVSKGATVLDPYMGSGTTGVACVQTGRSFIGIEIDPGYYAIAERRIAKAQAEMVQQEMAL